jgi:hypothetical protein
MVSTEVIVPEASVESSASGVHWGAIFVGAVGVTIILVSLGPGLGLATVSPWTPCSTTPATFGIAAGIWLIITQWLSAGLGGYLAGRLREKWVGVRNRRGLVSRHGARTARLTIIVVALLIVGSAVAGAVAAATPAPAAPVSPEAAECDQLLFL